MISHFALTNSNFFSLLMIPLFFIQGQNLIDIKNTLNTELSHVSNWIESNKLTLNAIKTSYMVSFSLMIQPPNIEISIDNLILEQASEYKFLREIIDDKLTWKSHILEVITKFCKINGILYKIRDNIAKNSLRQIYLSIAYPHLLYCSAV